MEGGRGGMIGEKVLVRSKWWKVVESVEDIIDEYVEDKLCAGG